MKLCYVGFKVGFWIFYFHQCSFIFYAIMRKFYFSLVLVHCFQSRFCLLLFYGPYDFIDLIAYWFYSCLLVDQQRIMEQSETLFRLIHVSNFTTSIQALMLLFQIVDIRFALVFARLWLLLLRFSQVMHYIPPSFVLQEYTMRWMPWYLKKIGMRLLLFTTICCFSLHTCL